MTDVVTRPDAGVDEGAGGPTSGDDVTVPTDPTYEWAPVEPEPWFDLTYAAWDGCTDSAAQAVAAFAQIASEPAVRHAIRHAVARWALTETLPGADWAPGAGGGRHRHP